MMKKATLLLFAIAFIAFQAQAQSESQFYRFDRDLSAHIGIGGVNYKGDLVKDNQFKLKGNINVGLKYRTANRFSLRADLTWYRLSATDLYTDRGLEFESSNVELSVSGMVDLLSVNAPYTDRPVFNAYAFLGVGVTSMSPKNNGTLIREQGTSEGDFAGSAFVVPSGLGITFKASDNVDLGLEGSYHFLFTDYLDGVSQRGDSAQNDGYAFINLKASFYLNRKNPMSGIVK